jgi:hypothetical protein
MDFRIQRTETAKLAGTHSSAGSFNFFAGSDYILTLDAFLKTEKNSRQILS